MVKNLYGCSGFSPSLQCSVSNGLCQEVTPSHRHGYGTSTDFLGLRVHWSVSVALEPVPQAHVRPILLDGADSPFYLEIPIAVINSLCLKPRKCLVFLGWCIGIDGVLAVDDDDQINTDRVLDARGTYYYVTNIDQATGGFLKNAFAIPKH